MRRVTAMVSAAAMVLVDEQQRLRAGKAELRGNVDALTPRRRRRRTRRQRAAAVVAAARAAAAAVDVAAAQGPMTVKHGRDDVVDRAPGPERPDDDGLRARRQAQQDDAGPGRSDLHGEGRGSTIEIETTRDMQGTAVTSKAVWSMDGEYLVQSDHAARAATAERRRPGRRSTRRARRSDIGTLQGPASSNWPVLFSLQLKYRSSGFGPADRRAVIEGVSVCDV